MKKVAYRDVVSIGLDVHYTFSQVCMRDARQQIVCSQRLDHRDRQRFRERLAGWPKGIDVVMEGSYGWGWVSQEMQSAGLSVALSNCYKVKQMARARGEVHNNVADARVQSLLPFEAQEWWRVWLPPAEVRDHRALLRYREDLVSMNVQLRNRIHAIMHEHGIFHGFSDLFGVKGRAFLEELCKQGKSDQVELQPGALEALRGNLSVLQAVRGQLAAISNRLRKELGHDAVTRRLDTLPGIGVILAHVIAAEIGDIRRFGSAGALGSYAMVVPRDNKTGEDDGPSPGQHVGKQGNKRLKWALLEASHGAIRKSPRLRAMYNRYTQGGTRRCQQGLVKIACELSRLIYLVWTRQVDYRECPADKTAGSAKSPSRRQRMQKWLQARSVAGQPSSAMTAVR